MGQGAQSKSLRIVSEAKGWSATKIWNANTRRYDGDMGNFDIAPAIFTNQAGTGRLPEQIPDRQRMFTEATESPLKERVTWNTPRKES